MAVATTESVPDLRFLVEPCAGVDGPRLDATELVEVAIGRGVRALDVGTFAEDPRLVATRAKRSTSASALRFEAVRFEGRAALLMLSPPGLAVRVNGQAAPRVAVLGVGDQLQLGDAVLHLTTVIHWLAPLRVVAAIPGGMAVMRALYRKLASNRHCLDGRCTAQRSSLWVGLAPLLVLPAVAVFLGTTSQGIPQNKIGSAGHVLRTRHRCHHDVRRSEPRRGGRGGPSCLDTQAGDDHPAGVREPADREVPRRPEGSSGRARSEVA